MVVQATPSADVWMAYALPYDASQSSSTAPIVRVRPRSTRSHWLSVAALTHRVPRLPSTARVACPAALDAVAGRPCESSVPVGEQLGGGVVGGVVVGGVVGVGVGVVGAGVGGAGGGGGGGGGARGGAGGAPGGPGGAGP